MIVRLTLIENNKLNDLGQVLITNVIAIPNVGDKIYYKNHMQQYNVIEKHFNILAGRDNNIELFIEKQKEYIK